MANAVKGEVELVTSEFGTLTLVLDMEALVEAEQAYGKPMERMMADAAQGFVSASRAMLWGALQLHNPNLTLRDASQIFVLDGEAAGAALEKAVELGFPDKSPVGNGGATKKPRRPKTSGRNGAKAA